MIGFIMSPKIPPQATSFEKVILASLLVIPETLDEYIEDLDSSIFYSPSHMRIMEAIQVLYSSSKAVDIVSVVEQLKVSQVEDVEPYQAILSDLVSEVDTNPTLSSHIEVVKSKFDLRRVIKVSSKAVNDSYEADAVSDEVLATAEGGLLEIYEKSEKSKPEHISKIALKTLREIEEQEGKDGPPGVPSGFTKLDNLTTGFHGGELIIVAARPGMGKTSLVLAMARNCGVPAAIFSLEMPKAQISVKLKSMESGIPLLRIRGGYLNDEEKVSLKTAVNKMCNYPIHVDDTPGLRMPELRSKLRRLKKSQGVKIALVDYLQLMRGHEKHQSREQEISSISRALKELAKELDMPIIALSQLSRAVEYRSVKRPQLSDLRESGAIEQDADMVMFIHRPEMYDDEPQHKGVAEIIIGKQRNGPTTFVEVSFEKNTTTFYNTEDSPNEGEEF